jgi:predicted CoA-substrate-specific enzyme activase
VCSSDLAVIPEHVADAKGAFAQNSNSRTVVDFGGNISKAICYNQTGDPLDVIQNDKCADGPGILYRTMSKALGLNEEEFSALALKTTKALPIAIQCNMAAESEAIDLLCQGEEAADVANAITKYIAERIAAMCTTISPVDEIVFAGWLAKSKALTTHISALLNKDIKVLDQPEYVGAVGAVLSYGGGN